MSFDSKSEQAETTVQCQPRAQRLVVNPDPAVVSLCTEQTFLPCAWSFSGVVEKAQPPSHLLGAEGRRETRSQFGCAA